MLDIYHRTILLVNSCMHMTERRKTKGKIAHKTAGMNMNVKKTANFVEVNIYHVECTDTT